MMNDSVSSPGPRQMCACGHESREHQMHDPGCCDACPDCKAFTPQSSPSEIPGAETPVVTPEQIKTVISELAFMRTTHVQWAKHFEQHPEIEAEYVATLEWDDAKEHRRCIDVYDRAITILAAVSQGQQAIQAAVESERKECAAIADKWARMAPFDRAGCERGEPITPEQLRALLEPPVPYDWNAPQRVAHDVTHGQCTACSVRFSVDASGCIPAKCSACGGVVAPIATPPVPVPPPSAPMDVPEESANDRFERLAEMFLTQTGMMPPGKDVAAAMGRDDYEIRAAAWKVWCAQQHRLDAQERENTALRECGAFLSNIAWSVEFGHPWDDNGRAQAGKRRREWDEIVNPSSRGSADHA